MTGISGTDAAVFSLKQPVSQTKKGCGRNINEDFAGIMSNNQEQLGAKEETAGTQKTEKAVENTRKFESRLKDDSASLDATAEQTASAQRTDDAQTELEPALDAEERELEETEQAVILQTAVALLTDIAKTLGVSNEELLTAMEEMGISFKNLTSLTELAKLATEVMQDADSMLLVTDENLFKQVKELSVQAGDTMQMLADELGMDAEQLQTRLEEAVKEFVLIEQTKPQETEQQPEVDIVVEKATTEAAPEKPVEQEMTESAPEVTEEPLRVQRELQKRQESHQETGQQAATFSQQNLVLSEMDMVTNAETPIFTMDFDAESIMNQIAERVEIVNKEEFSSIQMRLHPENLGNLQLQVKAKEGIITAQITTENESVRQVLEAQVVQLREKLEGAGVRVDAVEVMVASHEFEHNLEKGSEEKQEDYAPKKTARRRINLNVLDSEEQDLDAEETQARNIQVDMMKRNGNTLDYMA